jgi:hypothetical protein
MVGSLYYFLALVVRFLAIWLINIFSHGHHLSTTWQYLVNEFLALIYVVISACTVPIYSIALTLIYYDQRIRKEGYDIERMMEAAGMNTTASAHVEASIAVNAEDEEGQA